MTLSYNFWSLYYSLITFTETYQSEIMIIDRDNFREFVVK